MARYLVVANQTLGGAALERIVRDRIESGEAQFYIVVPTIDPKDEATEWDRGFAISEVGAGDSSVQRTRHAEEEAVRQRETLVGEAHVRAESRLIQMVQKIESAGGKAEGEVGGPEPANTVQDVLARFPFAEVIISTLPAGISRWLKTDLPSRVSRVTEVPVTTVEADN